MSSLQSVVDRYLSGAISAPLALMELLLADADVDRVTAAVATLGGAAPAMIELRRLAVEHARGCGTITEMLRAGLDRDAPAASIEASIADVRRLFDDSVLRSEESSVALYSLGSPELLAQATAEVVAVLAGWGVLHADRDALELGCGIGRFLPPLAARLRSVVGTDISANMIAAARRRTDGIANVRVVLTTGRDLAEVATRSIDLVYAIDVVPYLVRAGTAHVATHLREAARVLRPGGDLVIFNYAYGRDPAHDARELAALGEAAGFLTVRSDERPCRLWNGIGYHLRTAPAAPDGPAVA